MHAGLRFAIFLAVVLGVWAAMHLYVGWRLLSLPATAGPRPHALLLGFLVAVFLSYPLGRLLFAAGARGLGRGLEYAGALWVGILFLLVAALVAVDVVSVGGWLLRPWLGVIRSGAVALVVVVSVWAWWGGHRPPRLRYEEVELPGLPAAADGFRLAQVSDVHLGTILGRGRLAQILALTEAARPDVVALTGDLIDADAGVVEEMLPALQRLTAPHGVFAVLGNHEYYAGRQRARRLLAAAGYEVLDNAAVELVPGLWLAGVPDARGGAQTGAVEADLERALEAVPGGAAVVLLRHSPEDEVRAAAAGVGLMLDGHTHGGQLWPFSLLVRLGYPHVAGRFRVGAMTQIVSRGAGQWGPPMRLGAPAEIVVVTLRAVTRPRAATRRPAPPSGRDGRAV